MKKKTYQYVFLDLDDTIWDFHANAKLSLQDVFEYRKLYNYFQNFEEFFSIYEKKNTELWESYGKGEVTKDFLMAERFRYPLAKMGLNDLTLAEEIGIQYLDILPTKKTLVPHAKEVLDYLSNKYPLSIISNGFVEVQHKKLNSSGIRHYFKHIILSEEAKALKPDKRIFEYTMQLNGATRQNSIMIGDNYEADIKGAINAGIDQIYFPPHPIKKSACPPCTFHINNLKEVFDIL
ncbi:MAG: YjjG family noncanonical pyrimidine nucleotidase [Paludibacter sp.]|nr:YjjG family noncanonical pyrimidine nucleotidase [Paludibacter sp.]